MMWAAFPSAYQKMGFLNLKLYEEESKSAENNKALKKKIILPSYWEQLYLGCDATGGMHWLIFIIQTAMLLYSMASIIGYCVFFVSLIIAGTTVADWVNVFLYSYAVLVIISVTSQIFWLVTRWTGYIKEKRFRKEIWDGTNIKSIMTEMASRKEDQKCKRRKTVIRMLEGCGLYWHKKKYCINKIDLPRCEEILATQSSHLYYEYKKSENTVFLIIYDRKSQVSFLRIVVKDKHT